jgi:hypothetical protein
MIWACLSDSASIEKTCLRTCRLIHLVGANSGMQAHRIAVPAFFGNLQGFKVAKLDRYHGTECCGRKPVINVAVGYTSGKQTQQMRNLPQHATHCPMTGREKGTHLPWTQHAAMVAQVLRLVPCIHTAICIPQLLYLLGLPFSVRSHPARGL